MKKQTRQLKLSDQIREAIKSFGVTQYRICKDTGIDPSVMSRFMSGERGLTIPTLDVLAEYLGLRIITEKRWNQTG
jgi:transcriptional regulator with XRE-family HTH domain